MGMQPVPEQRSQMTGENSPSQLQRGLHQHLGVGAGNQHPFPHIEGKAEKFPLPQKVLQRIAREPAGSHLLKGRNLLLVAVLVHVNQQGGAGEGKQVLQKCERLMRLHSLLACSS